MVPSIICEEEGEENMATNLRVGLKKRQCKRLSESITVVPPSTKKPYIEILYPKPVSAIAPPPEPLVVTVGLKSSSSKGIFSNEGAAHPGPKRSSTSLAQLGNDSIECVASVTPCPQVPRTPSQEEID